MTFDEIKKKAVPLLQTYGVLHAGLFGSAARGEMGNESDIDILVDVKKDIGLLEFVELKQKLEEELGRKVDIVEYKTIKPAIRDAILKSQVILV